jgi:hypothetical protein
MKRSFALKLLSSVFLTGVILSQSTFSSQNQADQAIRNARRAQNPGQLTQVYNEVMQLPQRVRGNALGVIHDKAIDLPMASPGIVRPHNIPQNEFDAIAQTREFKQLSNDQQTQVLAQLDHTIGARVAGPLQPAEVQAALNHVVGGAQAGTLAGHVNHSLAGVAGGAHGAGLPGGGGGHGAGLPGGGGGGAVLVLQPASGLQAPVYNAVTGPAAGPTTIAQQNAIMPLVAAAILNHPGNQAGRDAAITAAVNANGNHPGYANAIILAVNGAHAIGGGGGGAAVLAMPVGMNINVYNAIIGIPAIHALTIPEQNQVLTETQAGINAQPAAGGARNAAIGGRLTALHNPAITGPVRGAVIAAVNAHQPAHVVGGGGAGVGGGGGGGIVMPGGMNVGLFNALTQAPGAHPAGPLHGLPNADQNTALNAIQHVLGGGHPNYSRARELAIIAGLNGTGVAALANAGLQEEIVGTVNEHLAAPPVHCPAITDTDVVDTKVNMGGAGAHFDKLQPHGAGPLWHITFRYETPPGAGFNDYTHPNPNLNAYMLALGAGHAATNLALDPANIGGNSVMLTAANTMAGQPFHGAVAADRDTHRPACRYTGAVNHNGNNFNLDVILTYGQED